ncbi:hypothetical protein T4B_3242 [Trichinella pseudospiralis]|uniref:Uncharacterized protein n=1 Tax=Trichinella pseudospiralis TaxID=6337 RepID=A0A0V1IE39_TRIPS|nr:hypothetical protein T4B_3242 [Trichinella pseudospiralis]
MGYCQVGALPRCEDVTVVVGARLSILTLFFPSIEQSQRSANETDLGELCRQMQRRSRQLMKCKRFDTPSRCSKPQLALSCISSTANNKVSKFILYSNPSSEIICTNLVHLLRLKRCELLAWEGCIFWNSSPDDSSLSEPLKLITEYLKMVRKVFSSSQAKIIKNAHEEDWEFITRAPLYTWDLSPSNNDDVQNVMPQKHENFKKKLSKIQYMMWSNVAAQCQRNKAQLTLGDV